MNDLDLLRNIHHAVRSPLGSILNVTEMMLLGMDGHLSPAQTTSVTCIVDDAQKLHRVGEALLDYLRLVESPVHLQAVDPNLLLRSAAENLQKADARVSLQLPELVSHLQTDPRHLNDLLVRAARLIQRVDGETNLSLRLETQGDGLDIYLGDPLPDLGFPPPDALLKAENGILFLTCRRLTTLMGGKLNLTSSAGGRIALHICFPVR